MTIETKYNIGDEVWFQTLGNIYRAKVIEITAYVFFKGNVVIGYRLETDKYMFVRCEDELFATEEELLKSL